MDMEEQQITAGRRTPVRRFTRVLASVATAVLVIAGLSAIPATAAGEEEIELPETVSANHLPTPQLNGVAWDLRVRGNVAYVVGSFTRVRPSGANPGGAGEVVRNNAMAFNITSGQILPWNPNFNAPVMDIEFSPDGSRFYAGGQFTAVSGQARSKIAEFTTSNGALTSFSASVGGSVETLAVTSDAVYLGGSFNSVANQTRRNVAKLNRVNAELQAWAPTTDDIVHGIIATDQSDRVVIGGRFQTINNEPKVGIGAVNETTGQQVAWSSTPVPARIDDNARAWVVDLKLENGVIYAANNGMGWHWFDGRFAADYATGDLIWLDNCYGSTSSISIMGDVVYSTPHAHDCSSVNGFPEENPMIWKRALAETAFATGTDATAPSNNSLVRNQPIPTLLHWYPSINTGTYTGQYQGGWAMDNNGDYLVLGGEFTRLNNTNQQGLAVFPKRSLSSNSIRPEYTAELKPSAISQRSGSVRVAWPTTWDIDDETLTYELLRDNSLTAIDSQDVSSIWWKKQSLGFRDDSVAPGSTHTYRVRVSDPWGNNYIGPRSDPVTVSNSAESPYTQVLRETGADIYYPLNESDGSVAFDNIGFVDADASAALQRGLPGAISDDDASGFSGQSLASRNAATAPDTFTTQLWFKTESDQGGKLIGYGSSATGDSGSYDRHAWMDNSGRLHFGTWLGWAATVSSSASYNDGQWHQLTATLGQAGMHLYVDGLKVAERTDVSSGQAYSGMWRIGGDNLSGWPNQPSSKTFDGELDEVAIFNEQIDAAAVLQLFQSTGRTADIPEPPADAYGIAVYGDEPQMYWRLDETGGNVATDSTIARNDGTINGPVRYAEDSAIGHGTSLGFGQSDAAVVSNRAVQNPTVFSTEAWFRTTTGNGGKIIGFGNAASGLSSSYDRHVYMRNDGTLVFGVYTGAENLVTTGRAYNHGDWHHLVATLSGEGMKLYVDGALTGTNPQTAAEPFNGYWRIGGDRVWSGASSAWFDGEIDEAAVYARALSQAEVNEHYGIAGEPNQDPLAEFTSTSQGLAVAFDASGSTDADGTIASYAWDFGDGQSTTVQTEGVLHEYAQAGTYTVVLTITDDRGGTATKTQQIEAKAVNQPPVAAIASEQAGLKVSLSGSGSADPEQGELSYEWDFGDGSQKASGQDVEHAYGADGEYTVTLTVTDSAGATAQAQSTLAVENAAPVAAMELGVDGLGIQVDGSGSADPEGGELEYAWDFGDGTEASGPEAAHEYAEPGTYEVTLVVTDEHGATGTVANSVQVKVPNTAPEAAFESTVDGLAATFSAAASQDADGQIVSWEWDFGDGTTGTGAEAMHQYSSSGTKTVTLTVTDNEGATGTASSEVTVQDPAELDPTAAFTWEADELAITVDASDSLPPAAGGEITGYLWEFGDGTQASGVAASHSYESAGTYSVTLTVQAGERESTISQVATVAAAQGPQAQFSTTVRGLALGVDASGSTAGDVPITAYQWDFGDGQNALGENAQHRYAEDGRYTVTLTVSDGNGLESRTETEVDVQNSAPVAAFSLEVNGLEVQVDGAASSDADGQIATYAWNFGDGNTASGQNASHEYAEPGDYQIKLVVTDEDGLSAELVQQVQVAVVAEPALLVSDAFGRTVSDGWGDADTGGTWTRQGSSSNFSVAGGTGTIRMSSAGSGPLSWLPATVREGDMRIKLSRDKAATGGGIYQTVTIRDIPGVGAYRAKVRFLSNGSVAVTLEKVVSGSVSALSAETVIGQVDGSPGKAVWLRLQAQGSSSTSLRAKAYNQGQDEPLDWQLNATDSTAALQAEGRLGLSVYLSGSANNAPVNGGFDDLEVREIAD
ncbi:PKD domain-containing protein [Glutamicibacter arilaitensis]